MNQALHGNSDPSWFQRFLLPGLAFKAVVIGGGYATGRELAEFFLPSGPWGGLLGMLLAMLIWSVVCALTFMFAQATRSFDYRSFFGRLLGPAWVVFEVAYLLFMVLILAVFGAAAGAIVNAMFGWPELVGTLCLMSAIGLFTAFGNRSVETLFKWVSFLLYGVYAIFLVLALSTFGDRVVQNFSDATLTGGWAAVSVRSSSANAPTCRRTAAVTPANIHCTGAISCKPSRSRNGANGSSGRWKRTRTTPAAGCCSRSSSKPTEISPARFSSTPPS